MTGITITGGITVAGGINIAGGGAGPAPGGSTRAVFGGGLALPPGGRTNVMDYVTIETLGNAVDFGDLSTAVYNTSACSSSTRGLFALGQPADGTVVNTIDYITIASAGNSSDFGDLLQAVQSAGGCSSSTRGVFAGGSSMIGGGSSTYHNVIQYVTIASVGNASDFGDLSLAAYRIAGCSSPTRGVFGGAFNGGGSQNFLEYITIASTGNAADFGDLIEAIDSMGGCSSSTRGLFAGGVLGNQNCTNVIQYITLASLGNATDFGDLLVLSGNSPVGASTETRAIFAGGAPTVASLPVNVIQYVTIASTGNAIDFGDLTAEMYLGAGVSAGHGGLQ